MPSDSALRRAIRLIEPWRRLVSPVFHGFDHIPDAGPLLFVGNHTVMGVLDAPLMLAEIYRRKKLALRALGDHAHFKIPLWRDLLTDLGVVNGTPAACAELMRNGEAILVFPGGGREVAKRRGEKYQLIWKQRLGFARLAIEHRCPIVPFAAVGAEDALTIVADANDLLRTPLGKLFAALRVRTDVIMPLTRGLGPTPLPRPERFYFSFGPPIRPTIGADPASLRDEVRASVEQQIAALREEQARDPGRTLAGRLRRR